MNDCSKRFQISLKFTAIIHFLAAAIHLAWLPFFDGYTALSGLNDITLNLLFIFNSAIVLFLVFTGVIAFYVASLGSLTARNLQRICIFYSGFWLLRLLLQIAFPVEIPLLIIDEPTSLLLVFMITPLLVLWLPIICNN